MNNLYNKLKHSVAGLAVAGAVLGSSPKADATEVSFGISFPLYGNNVNWNRL